MIIFRTDGVCIARMKGREIEVPPGAICTDGNQYVSHPLAVTPMNITFQVDSLVSVLGGCLDKIGYTEHYHCALSQAEALLRDRRRRFGKQQALPNKRAKAETAGSEPAPPDRPVPGPVEQKEWVYNDAMQTYYKQGSDGRFYSAHEWAEWEYINQEQRKAVVATASSSSPSFIPAPEAFPRQS